jgi:hypothetical protein
MARKDSFEYDAFISHAVEDKIPIANALCARLEQAGLKIWYSGRELRVGDRLTQTIEEGLAKSRFGIVVLSPTYLAKMWTLREFYSLLSRENDGRKIILPVLYDITPSQLAQKDLTMAEMWSVKAEKGVDHVVDVLLKEIRKIREEDIQKEVVNRSLTKARYSLFLLALVAAFFLGYYSIDKMENRSPEREFIESTILNRIRLMDENVSRLLRESDNSVVMINEISEQYREFKNMNAYVRNEYHMVSSEGEINIKKNVATALKVDPDTLTPYNFYSLQSALVRKVNSGLGGDVAYAIQNQLPVQYSMGEVHRVDDDEYSVPVRYLQNIRLVQVVLTFPVASDESRKKIDLTLHAMMPEETFLFQRKEDEWVYHISAP